MKAKDELTHAEACELVEGALERVGKTLAYIRLRLERAPDYSKRASKEMLIRRTVEEANILCNINFYGAYLQGAQRMALALKELDLLDFPSEKIGSGNYKGTKRRNSRAVNKAVFDLFMENTRNLEWCLHGLPGGVEILAEDKVNAKGKVIGVKARFVKKEFTLKEI